jgi:membrane protease YdiL (CAAX protease family)
MSAAIVTTSASGPPADPYRPIASRTHLIVVLVALGAWASVGKTLADQLSREPHPSRVPFYLITLALEWFMFVLVVTGVRRAGTGMTSVIGDHWRSGRQLLGDVGIAAAFWIPAVLILYLVMMVLRVSTLGAVQAALPRGASEIALWVLLSVTAGICEETLFRGYLQRQFTALTRSALTGILLSAAAFGAAHAYQGFRMIIVISLYGLMFGALAYWRRSVRPGMIAHAWHDAFSGMLGSMLSH